MMLQEENQDSNTETVVLMAFGTETDAWMARGILETYDIACFLSDEHINNLYPIYNSALGGIKLHVFKKDAEQALQILHEQKIGLDLSDQEDPGEQNAIVCPHCQSKNVRFGTATQNKYPWLVVLISILLTVYPFVIRRAYHCFNCGQDFKIKK